MYDQFQRVPTDRVGAGDICALTGLSDVGIGETICDRSKPDPLPTIKVMHAYQTTSLRLEHAQYEIKQSSCQLNHAQLCAVQVEDPTVRMTFLVNTSPFAGKEGKFVTSRNLKERLERELERNLVRSTS